MKYSLLKQEYAPRRRNISPIVVPEALYRSSMSLSKKKQKLVLSTFCVTTVLIVCLQYRHGSSSAGGLDLGQGLPISCPEHPPSPHTSCFQWLQRTTTWHEKLCAHKCFQAAAVRAQNTGAASPNGFVHLRVHPDSGLGNRFLALVSAYSLAVLSERVLVLDWPAFKEGVIHGLSGEKMVMPEFSQLVDTDSMHLGSYNSTHAGYDLANVPSEAALEEWGQWDKFRRLLCGPINRAFKSRVIHLVDTWDFFLPVLVANPHHEALFNGSTLGDITRAAIALVLPAEKQLQMKINKFVKEEFSGRFVIGLHVRRIGMNRIGMLGHQNILMHFLSCARTVALSANTKNLPVSYFVVSDDPAALAALPSSGYQNEHVILSPLVENSGRASIESNVAAMVELYLLGECNQLVQSEGSTYSGFAAARTNLPVITMQMDGTCHRPLYDSACYYDWPKVGEGYICDVHGEEPCFPEPCYFEPCSQCLINGPVPRFLDHGQGKCQMLGHNRLSEEIDKSKMTPEVPWSMTSFMKLLGHSKSVEATASLTEAAASAIEAAATMELIWDDQVECSGSMAQTRLEWVLAHPDQYPTGSIPNRRAAKQVVMREFPNNFKKRRH